MSASLNAFALFFRYSIHFLMSIYMLGIIRNSEAKVFNMALIQGSLISFIVFIILRKLVKPSLMKCYMLALNPSRFLVV